MGRKRRPAAGASPPGEDLESTAQLLARARAGEDAAREVLLGRYLPALQSFAHGRVPRRARDVLDTDDLVQSTVLRALRQIDRFQPGATGSFFAYLRTILLNQVRDQARRIAVRPVRAELSEHLPASDASPLEEALGKENLDLYERALQTLSEAHRQALLLRVDLDRPYAEIASVLGSPSANAARMVVSRALVNLSEEMRRLRGEPAAAAADRRSPP